MPTVHREAGFRFFFFSNEGFELAHIHVEKGDAYAKLWLQPISFAEAEGFHGSDLRMILRIVHQERQKFLEKWNDYFSHESL